MRYLPLTLVLALLAHCGDREAAIHFVAIPAGTFTMGGTARPDERPHRVTLSAFAISDTEVTQEQWRLIMGTSPGHFHGANLPVESVTWNEVQEFLRRLGTRLGGRYRLPTEAEWEYACRAGTATEYAFGDALTTKQASFDARQPMPVKSFAPNAWGLYDMHGNVWEWCADEYCPYPAADVKDPFQRCGSKLKVIRGGSWYFGADSARSALRYTHEPQLRGFSIGFRVVREASR